MKRSGYTGLTDGCIGCFLILLPLLGIVWFAFPVAFIVGGIKADSSPLGVLTGAFWAGGYDFALGWAMGFKHVLFSFWVIGFFVAALLVDHSRKEEEAKKKQENVRRLAREIAKEMRKKGK